MSAPIRPAPQQNPQQTPQQSPQRRIRLRGWVSLGLLLAFYAVGALHEFAPQLTALLGLGH
ncbi:hypothetical protein [Actinomycetospora chlora]